VTRSHRHDPSRQRLTPVWPTWLAECIRMRRLLRPFLLPVLPQSSFASGAPYGPGAGYRLSARLDASVGREYGQVVRRMRLSQDGQQSFGST
jgi:hypothetical protein